MGSTRWCVRTYQRFSSSARSLTKMEEESSRNTTIQAQPRWMLILLGEERARPRDVLSAHHLGTQRRILGTTKERARAKPMEKERVHLTRTVPPSLKVSAATAARKATSGQTAGSDWQKQRTRKFTLSEQRKPRRRQQWRPWKTPTDAEFFPLESACEEHTCPIIFSASDHEFGPSNVPLSNANGLSIPSGRRVMVSYNILGPGGRVVMHSQTPFVQSDVRSAGQKSSSVARAHGQIFKPTMECSTCLCG